MQTYRGFTFDTDFSATLIFVGDNMSAEVARDALVSAKTSNAGEPGLCKTEQGRIERRWQRSTKARRTLPVRARQLTS